MTLRLAVVLVMLVSCAGPARAALPDAGAPLASRPPAAGLVAPSGAPLPLAATFTDDAGGARPLGRILAGDAPVLLALGYDRCPQLCGMVLQGALEAAHATGLPASGYRLLFVSIDPRDGPADAATRLRLERGYAATIAGNAPAPRIDALVGAPADVAALASAIGFRDESTPDAGDSRYAHPAALFVLTPDGRLARRLGGVRYDPGELRAALADAAAGRASSSDSLGDRIALLCAHLDERAGHDGVVLAALRGVGLATLAALAALAWRTRRGGSR